MLTTARLTHRATDLFPFRSLLASREVSRERLANAVTALAGVAALAVALAVPLAYAIAAYGRLAAVLELRVDTYANAVAEAAAASPSLWNAFLSDEGRNREADGQADLSTFDLATPDDPDAIATEPEQRRVIARDGHVLLELPPAHPLVWPTIAQRAPVLQNGHRLGEVEIVRPYRPAALATAEIGLAALAVAAGLLWVLRLVPLRLMREALERASYLAAHDQLTGLPNRAVLTDRVHLALSAADRSGTLVAMLCLDLDHFKQVNDALGHAAGDQLLCTIATRLRACLRDNETLARLGGDEFAVVLPTVRKPHDAEVLAARLIEAVRAPVMLDGQQAFVGLSVGIAVVSGDVQASELAKQADMALYQAKEAGRGVHRFFAPEMNARLQRRRMLENDLRGAMHSAALALHYQPQIDARSGAIVGVEALMRWNRPGEGQVPPDVFIPVAEETGLIGELGVWLLQEACREACRWPEAIRVAVNVSPVQFRMGNFTETVRSALAASGLDPCRLEIEVTEGILLDKTDETLAILVELRALGVRVAMDDFGTGYASLGYLQKFHFDKIKIDKSFISELGTNRNAAAIVRAVVGLSDALGLIANAEGVENAEQIALLQAYGCNEMQGFHYWAPMPAPALRRLMTPNAPWAADERHAAVAALS